MLQVGGQLGFVDTVMLRGLDLPDGIAGEGELFGHGQPPAVRANGINQIARPVVNLEHGPLQECSGGQAGGGVVVGGPLDNLDLAGDGGILPFNLRYLARLDIDGFQFGVRDIALVLQLPEIVAAALGQAVNVDMAPLVAHILPDGGMPGVIQQEMDAGNTASVRRRNLANEYPGEGRIGHGLAGGFSILHCEIDGGVIQLEAFGTLGFHGVVIAALQGQIYPSTPPGGHGVHQGVIRHPADIEGGVGDALCLVRRTDLDELHTAHRRVVEPEFLRIIRVDHHGLTLCVRVDGISGDALYLSHNHCAGDAGEDDLALRIGPIQAIGGQLAALVREIGAVRAGDLELYSLQRGLILAGQLVDDEVPHRLVAELHRDGLALFYLNRLGGVVQQVARFGPGLLDDQCGAGLHTFHQEGPGGVRHKFAVGVAHHGAVRFRHQELHIAQGGIVCCRYLLDQDGPLGGVGEIEGHNVLVLAGEIERLGRGVNDMAAVTLQLLADVVALFEPRDGEGAVGGGHIGPHYRSTGAADLAAQVFQLETAAGNSGPRHTVLLVDHQGRQGRVGYGDGLVLAALDIDLRNRVLRGLIARGGLGLLDFQPAVLDALQDDLACFIRLEGPQVPQLSGVRFVAGPGDMELGILDRVMGDGIFFLYGDGGPLVVFKIYGMVLVGVEGDKLGLRVHQVRGRHRFFGNFVHAGQ